jgi:hypothetical protein
LGIPPGDGQHDMYHGQLDSESHGASVSEWRCPRPHNSYKIIRVDPPQSDLFPLTLRDNHHQNLLLHRTSKSVQHATGRIDRQVPRAVRGEDDGATSRHGVYLRGEEGAGDARVDGAREDCWGGNEWDEARGQGGGARWEGGFVR